MFRESNFLETAPAELPEIATLKAVPDLTDPIWIHNVRFL
jgi:hypothetical protein